MTDIYGHVTCPSPFPLYPLLCTLKVVTTQFPPHEALAYLINQQLLLRRGFLVIKDFDGVDGDHYDER